MQLESSVYKKTFRLPDSTRAALRMQAGTEEAPTNLTAVSRVLDISLRLQMLLLLFIYAIQGKKFALKAKFLKLDVAEHTEVTMAVPRASSSLTWIMSGSAAQMQEGNIWHWLHWSWEEVRPVNFGDPETGNTQVRMHTDK